MGWLLFNSAKLYIMNTYSKITAFGTGKVKSINRNEFYVLKFEGFKN